MINKLKVGDIIQFMDSIYIIGYVDPNNTVANVFAYMYIGHVNHPGPTVEGGAIDTHGPSLEILKSQGRWLANIRTSVDNAKSKT